MSRVESLQSITQSPRYFYIAIIFSVFLHFVIVGTGFYKTETNNKPTYVVAAPLLASIIAPLASPKHTMNNENVGVTQQDSEANQPQAEQSEEVNKRPKSEVRAAAHSRSEFKADKKLAKVDNKKPLEVDEKRLDQNEAKKQSKKLEKSLGNATVTEQTDANVQKQAQAVPTAKEALLSNKAAVQQQGPLNHQGQQEKLNWQQMLYLQLEKEKRYPRSARRMRRQGVPTITFTMNRSGKVLDVYLVNSSGIDSLDKEAVALVYRAEPLPQPPASIAGLKLTLTVPISFSM
ncbi:hypothetical protein CWB85_13695 [Pseudoalteromonas sp. S1727]|uniref:cell envelope integrity protein TolA n=1 Tax=Pseudoalteromonas sp. S1727 TaxID=2066514 RepID=UPI001109FCA1|nr:TonB family protein [Pseudoalteromonas sp. S1727]TMN70934.1 hypothetical protein CWB85_13695 [Pseudoalteromonas sp. S1727]